jgi:intracellular sulfur oxidation DsrE/DsrF family protein
MGTVSEHEMVLCVGDTTFLDYGKIAVKREGYGPIGNGGNGLILHSALAINPQHGQPLGLLWQKLWNREHKPKPADETPKQKKQRQALARKAARKRGLEQKESYRWVEALKTVDKQVGASTRVIHVFDREGDIAEVFEQVRRLKQAGVVVRAAHNRSIDSSSERLWALLEAQPIQFYQDDIELPKTDTQVARTAKVAVRFCQVSLRTPYRFDNRDSLQVYAVYACEVEYPDGATPLAWMLLTTEVVTTVEMATTILRWYCYRWRVEEYHKLLKSGTQVERYRLAADGMKTLLGFLSVIAVELLHLTYLHRTQPEASVELVLNPTQIVVLKAKSPKLPKVLTVAWALQAVARLGGYLEHRRQTPIGIQVLWRGWLKLQDLCEGWQLAHT